MKLDNVGGSQSVQSLTYSLGNLGEQNAARIAPTEPSAAQPAAVYHGSETPNSDSLLNKSGSRLYAQMLCTQEEWDENMKVPPGVITKIGPPSGSLRWAYDAALSRLSPELRAKDWGFSVSDGHLVLTTGADPLSDAETAAIHVAFQEAGVQDAANAVADVIVQAIEEDRYWLHRYLGKGIGVYDVSTRNFGDIVDLRTYMEDFREGNRYDPHLVDPTNYERGYGMGGFAIMEQIAARATKIDVPKRMIFV